MKTCSVVFVVYILFLPWLVSYWLKYVKHPNSEIVRPGTGTVANFHQVSPPQVHRIGEIHMFFLSGVFGNFSNGWLNLFFLSLFEKFSHQAGNKE